MKLFFALFFATTGLVAAQSPEVPHKMQFADMTLTIRDDARKEIQKDVDAFTRYAKSFQIKVERAKTYFPIIEKIFAEENVPDDFKYLVIQESALIPDAVSVSNAVGFWQFKDFTAIEMGLRVDKSVDERMNIFSSSRAAARYLKKNNAFFDNWLYALQAYQMGAGGVMRSVKETRSGAKHMDITSSTYWYVKKYLAHKIAYEGFIKGDGEVKILTYSVQNKKSLAEIAREVAVDEEEVKVYNKWLKSSTIPDDRTYAVAIPVRGNATSVHIPDVNMPTATADASRGLRDTATPKGNVKKSLDRMKINGIQAIRAAENETPTRLAARAGVDLSTFLKWNDISISDRLEPGRYFFLGKKRVRATSAYHKVSPGESLWSVSQQYGVQLKRLKKYNRLKDEEEIKPGMTLWLSAMKPRTGKALPEADVIVEVDKTETFNWEVSQPESKKDTSSPPVVVVTPKQDLKVDSPQNEEAALPQEEIGVISETPEAELTDLSEKADSVDLMTAEQEAAKVNETVPNEIPKNVEEPVKTEHVVQPKETLYGIAREYNIGVMDLVKWNNLDLQQGIKPGQVLKVTESQEIAMAEQKPGNETLEHIVKASDTVYSIARKYGVTIKELMEWNNKKDFALSVGEKLKIRPR